MDKNAYDAVTYARIPDFWEALMRTGHVETGVVKDHERPAGRQIVGFVTFVFPSNEFVAEIQTDGFPPYVNCQIVRRWIRGKSPLLTTEQVRQANGGGGVNLLTSHFGLIEDDELGDDPTFLRDKMNHVCSELGLGYNTRRVFIEVCGRDLLSYNLNAGMHLISPAPGNVSADDADTGPFLLEASRDESLEGTMLGPYFLHQPPRIHFKDGERLLLRRALLGESDEETAQALDVSLSTIHKRWLAIYERAGHVFPELFPGAGGVRGTDDVKRRGLEKRRHLLAYVQSHREELRPYPHPVGPRRGKDDLFEAAPNPLTIREHAPAPAAKSA